MRRPGPIACCRCGDHIPNIDLVVCDYIRDHMAGQDYIGLVCSKCGAGPSVTWNICRVCGLQFGDCENDPAPAGEPLCFWCEEDLATPSE